MATKKKGKGMKAWEIGGALTAATVAVAAGAYLLSDKKTKAKAKKWAVSARKEVAKSAKMAKKLGEKEYGKLVDQTVKHYGSMENVTAAEVIAAAKDLKAEWKNIHARAQKMGSTSASKGKRAKSKKAAAKKTTPAKKKRA